MLHLLLQVLITTVILHRNHNGIVIINNSNTNSDNKDVRLCLLKVTCFTYITYGHYHVLR